MWRSGIQVDVMDLPRKKGPQPPAGKGFPAPRGLVIPRRMGVTLGRKEGRMLALLRPKICLHPEGRVLWGE